MLAVIALVAIAAIYYLRPPVREATRLSVTVEITDPAQVDLLGGTAITSKTAYLNSIDVPLDSSAALQGATLQIALTGSGHIGPDGLYYFNGQRLLIGQKAEIHGAYFAQGKITKIEYAK